MTPNHLTHRVASLLVRPGESRDRLTEGIFISDDPDDITGCLEDALLKSIQSGPIERRLRHDGLEAHELEEYADWVDRLLQSEDITAEEAEILLAARAATRRVIMVDDFTADELMPRGSEESAVA